MGLKHSTSFEPVRTRSEVEKIEKYLPLTEHEQISLFRPKYHQYQP